MAKGILFINYPVVEDIYPFLYEDLTDNNLRADRLCSVKDYEVQCFEKNILRYKSPKDMPTQNM